MRLLLLSNSTNPGEDYLAYSLPFIQEFVIEQPESAVFIPYAGVTISWDEYYEMVSLKFKNIGINLIALHKATNPLQTIMGSDLIVVGGGNTFNLLKTLQGLKLIEPIQQQVKGGIPYIGWSAGSNIVCPTIKTTNDMPIVEPDNFNALGLISFQINPHYTDATIEGHGGESRDTRIAEFLTANPGIYVAGLREGTMFQVEGPKIELKGNKPCKIFKADQKTIDKNPNEDFSFLVQ